MKLGFHILYNFNVSRNIHLLQLTVLQFSNYKLWPKEGIM
jgi:hypothetical protein